VVGEAGIGKTRLVSAVVAETLSRRCRVLVGRCHESESILPFGPWVDACRSGQVSGDEEILGALHPTRRSELARLLPEASAPGRPPPSDSALPLFESVAELIELVALRQPVVLVLEDVHWADEMSLRLLAFVSRRLPAWRALLVASVRADELVGGSMAQRILEDLSRASRITPVVLSPLSRADTALLVRALARIGSDAQAVAKVAEQIWAMSEGNPFVTVEAMHALDQAGVWAGDGGAPGALALPASVRDLVARRLDGLSAPSQEVAAVAAVIGRQFGFTLLQSASGMDEGHAAHAVEEMVRHHLLQAVGNQLEFTHDRIRDVAAGRLLPARRRVLHRAVAEALEAGAGSFDGAAAFTQDHLSEQIEQLAHHCLRGELWEKAVHYLRQAGLRSAARSALPDARVRFEQALDVLEALPESPSNLEQAFEIRLELRPVLTQLGEVGRTLERLREAETLAERLDDDVRRGRVYAFLTNIRAMVGELDGALAAGTRALALAERLADVNLRILSTTYLEVTRYYRGEYEHVVTLATDALAALPGDRADEYLGMPAPPSVYDRSFLVLAMAELGRFSEAAAHEAEAMRRAELTQHAYTIGMACRTTAMLHLLKGDWPQALSRLERGIIALRTGNVPLPLPILLASSAWALAQVGEATEALNRLREGEQLLDRQAASGLVGQSGWVYQALGRVSLLLGRLDEAQQLGERALTSCPHHFGFVAHALHLLADIATHPDRADAASGEAHYDKALALAGARGMRPLVAHCHLGLGKLYARSARPRQARHAFTTATAMYREMGMRYWLEHARAERLARA
jgi:tetratricopeptide (TPR) repeat protein